MDDPINNGWQEYKLLIVNEISRLDKTLSNLDIKVNAELHALRRDIEKDRFTSFNLLSDIKSNIESLKTVRDERRIRDKLLYGFWAVIGGSFGAILMKFLV